MTGYDAVPMIAHCAWHQRPDAGRQMCRIHSTPVTFCGTAGWCSHGCHTVPPTMAYHEAEPPLLSQLHEEKSCAHVEASPRPSRRAHEDEPAPNPLRLADVANGRGVESAPVDPAKRHFFIDLFHAFTRESDQEVGQT